jgi:ribokinase
MKPVFVLGSVSLDHYAGTLFNGTFPGGKGSNQAIAAKRAGAETVILAGKTGRDGGSLRQLWEREGIDATVVQMSETSATGYCEIVVGANGESVIARDSGANLTMTDADVLAFAAKLPDKGIFVTQLSSTVTAVVSMIQLAKKRGLTVILTPAPVMELPENVWRCVDIITPNEAEAAQLDDYRNSLSVKTRIVTLGAKGVLVQSAGQELLLPAFAVNAVDTTGCGDAFTGAFAAALANGASVWDAARYGNAAGALCSLGYGASSATPYKTEIEAMLKEVQI